MPLVTNRSSLSQGGIQVVSDAAFVAPVGAGDIRVTSAGANLPTLIVNDFVEVRDHSLSTNNGLYRVAVYTSASDMEIDKVSGLAPVNSAAEAITSLGNTATPKSVMFDTAGLGAYLLEKGNVDVAGVVGQATYSFAMQEWKNDDFLIANAPFPMLTIDSDAGKYIIGQDISGNNSGWNWVDAPAFGIRTRKLHRNMGWDEVDANGNTTARYAGILTVDAVEDPINDKGFFRFGTDTTVDNTLDFDFAGAVNEAVQFFAEQVQTDLVFTATTITRVGGSFITEGYKVGGQVTIRNANTAANNITATLTTVSATVLTTSGLTIDAADTVAILAVNNANAFTMGLRVRDGDPNGKTFSQSNLAAISKPSLGNFVFQFPMPNATDLKISATDVTITGSAPYTGMSITFFAVAQARAGLVGGSFNFGIIGDANDGTSVQFFEFVQFSLRLLTDIDAGAGTHIGRAIDLLARFNGEILELGSPDGGVSFPNNPEGGGAGFYCDNLNAASANNVKFWDNLGVLRSNPETIPVTLDFNQTAIDDAATEYDLFYDRTIRTAAAALTDFVLTSATNKITSAGSNLPQNPQIVVGKYIRISGLTGTDVAMNGVYQITTINIAGADWTIARYDGLALVDVAASAVDADQNCIDTPDNIIVHTNVSVVDGGTTMTFTAPATMSDSANGFGVLSVGDVVEIVGSTSNDGIYEVATVAVGALTFVEQTIATEAASGSAVVTKIVSGLADADEVFSYDFDGNTQGGRTVSTTTFVKAKAVGLLGAQYVESTVQQIATGTPVTIPLSSATERNVA